MKPTMVDRDTFLQNVRISKLLTSQQFRMLVDKLGHVDNPREIAKALATWKLITKFQASMLLTGRNSGFILGPYCILDVLGQGGMGRVYKAIHQTMNRIVALKILTPQLVKTERAHQLFLREVQTAAQLNHPNIVLAYDANEIDGRHYLAMEFVDGPNLERYVRKNGPLPIGLACELIFQTAAGLRHAGERGMVHRDIKPANLLFQQDPGSDNVQVKILDFGLARLQQPVFVRSSGVKAYVEKENTVMGTPDFLSPDQAKNIPDIDIRSDLYSLGCTFYYLLSGKVPFPGGTALEKVHRHISDSPAPLEELRPDVPRVIGDIVRKLMEKNPADRFQTPDELMETLSPHAAPSMMDLHLEPAAEESPERVTDEIPPSGQGDTEPRAQASTQITDQESILEWVDTNRRQRLQSRRAAMTATAIIGAGVLTLAVIGALAWWLLL